MAAARAEARHNRSAAKAAAPVLASGRYTFRSDNGRSLGPPVVICIFYQRAPYN